MPEFYLGLHDASCSLENSEILFDRPICPKMPEFFMTFARKIFPRKLGTRALPDPPSPTPID